jgi:glycosyltransferase involved in cell wall biosynthesis
VPKKPHTVLQLLFVGRFTIEKNIFTLIQLIKELPEHQFSLTIVGYGHLEKKLRSYANNLLGVYNNQITFVINPDKLQLCALYQAADLFVFASITETNPLVFAEALSCGTPIIALKNAWHSDQLVDNFNGFWAENRTHMKQLVIHIAHNRDLFEQLQYGAWQTSSYFHAKHLGKELEKIYYQLVKY